MKHDSATPELRSDIKKMKEKFQTIQYIIEDILIELERKKTFSHEDTTHYIRRLREI